MRSGADLSGVGDDEFAGESAGGDVSVWIGRGGVAFFETKPDEPGSVKPVASVFGRFSRT